MPIDTKDSYKYRNQVRVKVDSSTEEGKRALEAYKKDQKYHYMDIGRVGRHLPNGKYFIEKPIVVELIRVPKIIKQVREKAIDKAGKDVYELKTFLSRFGELDFYATVDYNRADLYFVEHVWVENLGIQENYSTLIYSIFYENKKVPMKEIFYKFNISANADDYGKRWEEEIDITNTLIAKTKACLAMTCANTVAKTITQAALEKSIDAMEENSIGKKVLNSFNKSVKRDLDLKYNITKTPELTKTNLFLNAIDNVAGNKELRNLQFVDSVNKVLDIQSDKANFITSDISKATTPLCICNKFTELQESSVATIEGSLGGQLSDAEMVDGMLTSRTVLQVMPDGSKKVVIMMEPTDPLIENFDIKNESLVTQIRLMNSDFDNIMTIDGQPVDVSVARFDEESKKTRAYLVLQGMQTDNRFDIYATQDEKEFKKKIKRMTVQEAEEMKRLRAQYREIFNTLYADQKPSDVLFRDLDADVFKGQLEMGEGPVNFRGILKPQEVGEERLRPETERLKPTEVIQAAAEDIKEAIVPQERVETEEEKEKKKLVERARELDESNEKEILERQQQQAEELQEEVIEAQQRGEDIEKHLENIEKQKAEIQQNQEGPAKKEDQEAVAARNKLLEEEKNHELTTQREKELADIADKQLKEEEERKRRQTQMQLDLEAAERMAEDDLEDMMDDTPDYTSVEQDNINASGSEVFESEHHSDFVKQDNEGVAVISDAPAKDDSITLEM